MFLLVDVKGNPLQNKLAVSAGDAGMTPRKTIPPPVHSQHPEGHSLPIAPAKKKQKAPLGSGNPPEKHNKTLHRDNLLDMPQFIHLNVATCKWRCPFILVEKAMFQMVAKWRSFKKPCQNRSISRQTEHLPSVDPRHWQPHPWFCVLLTGDLNKKNYKTYMGYML